MEYDLKLSIVTAAYDATEIARQCVEAVHNNTNVDYEHIIFYNHPPEDQRAYKGMRAMLVEKAKADPHINLIDPGENIGCFAAINRGFEMAKGEFLCKLDCDTIVPGRWDVRMLKAFEKIPELAYLSAYLNKDLIMRWERQRKKINGVELEILPKNMVTMSCCIYRRSAWEKLGPFNLARKLYGGGEAEFFHKSQNLGLLIAHHPRVVCQHKARTMHSHPGYGTWKLRYARGRTRLPFDRWLQEAPEGRQYRSKKEIR
jgi:GT2 family glycosyltransferase